MSTRQPMRTSVHATGVVPDLAKWIGAFVILGGGIAGFYYWSDESLLLRVIGLLVLSAAALFVAVQTEKGRAALGFRPRVPHGGPQGNLADTQGNDADDIDRHRDGWIGGDHHVDARRTARVAREADARNGGLTTWLCAGMSFTSTPDSKIRSCACSRNESSAAAWGRIR